MKNTLKKMAECILMFAKANKMTCICFLLAISVALTGAASFAKYVSGDPIANNPSAAGFHNSAQIDGVSALSFTNMAFWGGLKDIGVSMNSLRTVNISVNNFEILNNEKLSTEVPSEYSLIFEMPQNFSDELALQLIGGDDTVLTTEIVLYDLLSSVSDNSPTATVKTQEPLYNGKPYQGETMLGNVVNYMTFNVSLDTKTGIYTFSSSDKDGTVITVEPFIRADMLQTLYFRLWDVEEKGEENVELESGTLLTPLIMTFREDVPFYRITVSRPDFTLGAGGGETDNYKLTLAPVDALQDVHLGGYIMSLDQNGALVQAKTIQANKEFYLSTVTEVVSSYDGEGNKILDDKVTLMGNIPNHIVGRTEVKDVGTNARETIYNDIYVVETTEETSTTDTAHTKYYTYRTSNRRWSNANSSTGLYRIRNFLTTTTTTTTYYDIKVYEVTKITEEITTDYVSPDKTHVEQTVERKENTTVTILEVTKRSDVLTTYSEKYEYAQRSNTGDSWRVVNSFSYNFTGSYPTSYELEDSVLVEGKDEYLTPEEVEDFKTWDDIAPYLTGIVKTSSFYREKNYTGNYQKIIPETLYTADDSISLDPLNTHITQGGNVIQKYYVSTSYSKNYPCSMKVHFEQVVEPVAEAEVKNYGIIQKKEAIYEEDIK